ncbi:alpha/beta hydrolase [Mycobacterium persicum]|uniref:DUF1023 domain-containing protein n=1 Tax=Mycobacterium persicum TaxID=1487726 RepID=A0A1X0L6V0_9MYCO|nr:alpha/beta hydrolase [Mycobacterium persicum]ORB53327.1 hypothetical protein BST40_08160 [Mycobacterium persicum]ORB89248.1 hypothetical protein B1T49_08360 [Mycobacterium persicum]ORB94712.1 hypothetical protein B1T44_09495 [Mycobacterium persicum]ORC01407.1 hypothetical protein B1T48_08955 [Mycobacterium persicum]ORC06705.1 hypothetical protein B4U45_08815 [Mycobacterium persicum]
MALTLADIERWDPAAIRTVFQAAIDRAHGTRTTSAALTDTVRLLDFGGDAADAALAATHRTTLLLDDHADACEAVARAAEKSADEVAAIKLRLQAIRDSARDYHLTIDNATPAALPPADLSSYSPADQQSILNAAIRLTENIKRLLADAETADEDLAAAIRGAAGDLSPEQVNTQLSHEPPKMPQMPPPGSDPKEVSKWWHSLTPGQQDRVKQWFPNAIRNLDGVPTRVRNELNVPVLQRELDRLQRGWLDGNGVWHTDTEKLADLQALQRALTANAGSSLILLDTTSNSRKVLAAVGIGDVDNAERVGVTVGGLNTRVSSSVEAMVGEAKAQRNKALELRSNANVANPGAVASIAWLGYDAPDSLKDVTHDWSARDAAGPLNRFYTGLAAATNASDQHITAFGHSYGSLVTSLALQQGAPVSDVVLYGSPGTELTNASQLGVQPGHAYYMIGVNDDVSQVIPEFGAFGAAPQDVPGMTELSTSTGLALGGHYGDGNLHERAYGHSEYARMGSNGELRMSGYNMAAVLAGLPDDLITPRAVGVDRLPGGAGPYEVPPPIPRQHV